MARVRKLTPNQQAWKKEVRRLERFQREASKRGYRFAPDIIPEQPKRITKKALRRLEEIDPVYQYERAMYVDPLRPGTVLTGVEGRKLERSRASKKGWRRRRYRAQEAPDYTESVAPTATSLWGALGERLDELPDVRYVDGEAVDTSGQKSELQVIYDETTALFEEVDGGMEWLDKYVSEKDGEFQQALDQVAYDSSKAGVAQAKAKLARLLNVERPLDFDTLKGLEQDLSDLIDTND